MTTMYITLSYKLKISDDVHIIEMTPEQYFDPIESDESFEHDAIAKYDFEKYYICEFTEKIDFEELEFTTIELKNSVDSDYITKTTYFDKETNVIYKKEKKGYELIVQSIKVALNCIVITRMERDNPDAEWSNVNLNVGVNYRKSDIGEEVWYDATKGEVMDHQIP